MKKEYLNLQTVVKRVLWRNNDKKYIYFKTPKPVHSSHTRAHTHTNLQNVERKNIWKKKQFPFISNCMFISPKAYHNAILNMLTYIFRYLVTQTSLIACLRFSALDNCLYATLSFVKVYRFSNGLRSGLFLDHSFTISCFFFWNSVAAFDWRQRAQSWTKIVQLWT